MLKRFRKTIQDATGSPGRGNAQGTAQQPQNTEEKSKQDEASGFICPMCMAGFSAPDQLQVHFDQMHAENLTPPSEPAAVEKSSPQPAPIDVPVKNQDGVKKEPEKTVESKSDIEPLHAVAPKSSSKSSNKASFDSADGDASKALETKENYAYNDARNGDDAIKQEISDLEASLNEEKWYSKELKTELDKKESELNAQLKDSELVKQQMGIAIKTNEDLAREKEIVLNKLATKSQECANLQSQVDEFKSEKVQYLENAKNQSVELEKAATWIRELEAQLNERPAADDFLVLKKELVSVQMLMDQLTQDSEKQKDDAEKECKRLEVANAEFKTGIETLKQKHDQVLLDQKNSQAVLVESLQQKESETTQIEEVRSAEFEKIKEELENTQSELENEQSHSKNLELKNNDLEEKLIGEKEEKEKSGKELSFAKEEISKLKKENEIQKVELSDKEESRGKTQRKLDDLMQQMGKVSSDSDVTIKERDMKIEALTQEYEDAIAKLATTNNEAEGLKSNRNALQEDLEKLREVHSKLELSKTLEEQKYSQEIEELTSKLTRASSSDSELQKQIEQLELEAKKAWDENQEEKTKSRMTVVEKENQISQLNGEKEKLENEIQGCKNLLQDEQEKCRNLETTSENLQEQIKSLDDEKASLITRSEAAEKNFQDATTKIEALSKEKEDVLLDIKRLQQERNDLMEKMEVGEGQAILVGQLKDENQSLLKRQEESSEKFKAQVTQHEDTVAELQNAISEDKAKMKQQQEQLTSSQSLLKNFEAEVTGLKAENSQQNEKLQGKDEELKKMQDSLSGQKLEFENRTSLLQRSLDEKIRDYDKLSSTFEGFKTSSETSLKTIEEARAGLQERFNVIKEENTRIEMEIKAKDEKLAAKENDLAGLNSAIENLKGQHQKEIENAKARHQERKSALESQLQSSQEQYTTIKRELESANVRATEVETNLAESDKKIKLHELDIKDKENSIENFKSELESAKMQISQGKDDMQKSKGDHLIQVTQLNEKHSKAVKEMQEEHKKVSDGLKVEIQNLKTKSEQEAGKLKKEVEEKENFGKEKILEIAKLEAAIKVNAEELDSLRNSSSSEKDDMTKKLSSSADRITQLELDIENLKSEQGDVQKLLEDKNMNLSKTEEKLGQLEKNYKAKEERLESVGAELETMIRSLKEMTEKWESTSTKLSETQELLRTAESKIVEMESTNKAFDEALKSSGIAKESVEKKLEEAETKITDAGLAMAAKEEEIKALKEYFSTKEKEMALKTENLSSEVERCKAEILEEKNKLEEEEATRKRENGAWMEEKEKMAADARVKESQWQGEKEELTQAQEMLKGAQQILISSKMELQKQLDASLEDIQSEKAKFEEADRSHREQQTTADGKITGLMEELETTKQTLKTTEDEKQNVEARLKLEVSTLRDNLDSVRGEWQQALQQVEEKNTESDDLRGQVVVLQATVQNNADERRALLERCFTAEQSVEQMKQNETQLKRRLDDAQAAMHELGRENQAMQVKHTTVLSRQWADDSEAKECVACRKPFSFAVRKHHCRHCGKIFCAECSSKNVTVAASKKPVRVCEKCYDDLLTVQ